MNIRVLLLSILVVVQFSWVMNKPDKTTIFLIGDSTVADYANNYDNSDYKKTRYPVTGWGQVFQPFMKEKNLVELKNIIKADSVLVINKARGGRSTRTFFEEGRWAEVLKDLKKDDLVLIQFGHNDAAENRPEKYVNIQGYKEYLRLYVTQTRERGAIPVLLTPVSRNYPWKDGRLFSSHKDYPQAMKEVAAELNVSLIDLTQLSVDFFTSRGQEYVTNNYFMNLPAGVYEAYPDGLKDNTHFQPEGAREVARLVFEALKGL